MHSVRGFFPTPIYIGVVENADLFAVQADIAKTIDTIEWKGTPQWGTSHELSTETFKEDIISQQGWWELDRVINEALEYYMADLNFGGKEYNRTSWATRYQRGGHAITHNHGFADLSGCYYFKTNGKDGQIFFENPSPSLKSSYVYDPSRRGIEPKEGGLLIFPGWLDHGVYSNDTDNTRISIAFNIFFKRFE